MWYFKFEKEIKKLFILLLLMSIANVQAAGVMFYGLEDGSVVGLHMGVGAYNGDNLLSSDFFGTTPNPATGRNFVYDRVTDLMWYSASDNNVHSVVVSSGIAGPTINDVNDGFFGVIRTLAIDVSGRRLYISNSNGDVEVYQLVSNTYMYTISLISWGVSEPNPGNRRHLAVDNFGLLWYAAADGSFKQFNPSQVNPQYTGVEIPFSEQIGNNPGQERNFDIVHWPSGQNYLYYAASDGTVRTLDIDSLTNINILYLITDFATVSNPGSLRTISIDETWVPSGDVPVIPDNIVASKGTFNNLVRVTWNPVSNAGDGYPLYRRDPGQSTWTLWNSLNLMPTSDDTFVTPGVNYEYAVKACNLWGCSGFSGFDTGWAASVLVAPTELTASQGTFNDRIRLKWNAVSGAQSYFIQITPPVGLPFSAVTTSISYDHFATGQPLAVWSYVVSACTSLTGQGCGSPSIVAKGWLGDTIFENGFE